AAAAIEQSHDELGMIWPAAIAPFQVVICPIGWGRSEAVREAAGKLYTTLVEQGIETILDDRDARPGAMFADWELIGVPHRVTVGERGLKNNIIECQTRRDGQTHEFVVEDAAAHICATLKQESEVSV